MVSSIGCVSDSSWFVYVYVSFHTVQYEGVYNGHVSRYTVGAQVDSGPASYTEK